MRYSTMKILVLTALIIFTCASVFALPSSLTIRWSEKPVDNQMSNQSTDCMVNTGNDTYTNTNNYSNNNNPQFCGDNWGYRPNHHYSDRPYCGDNGDDYPNDNVIPEPTTILLMGLGGLGMGIYRKFRK